MKRYLTSLLLLLTAVVCFNSCDKDIVDEITLEGKCWQVLRASYGCPYEAGDRFSFYSNNQFVIEGDGGLLESGSWKVNDGKMQIKFGHSANAVDIEAPMPVLNDDYCTLDCHDYIYDMDYTVELYNAGDLSSDHYYGKASPEKQAASK